MKFKGMGTALLLLMSAGAYAQPRFEVPFTFHIGERTLAAGTYTVLNDSTAGWLMIRSERGPGIVVLPLCNVKAATASSTAKLVFHRYGDTYFLSQIWRAGYDEGSQLRESKTEREIAKGRMSPEPASVLASMR